MCERRSRLLRLNRTPPCIDFAGSPQHGPPHRPRGIPAGATEEAAPGWGEHLRRRSQAWSGTPTARPNRIHAAGQQDVTRVLAERSSPNRFTFLEAIRLAGSVREEAAPGPSEETQRCSAHGLGPLGERAKPGSIVRADSQRAVSEGSEPSARAAGPQPASACVSCCLRITSHYALKPLGVRFQALQLRPSRRSCRVRRGHHAQAVRRPASGRASRPSDTGCRRCRAKRRAAASVTWVRRAR